MKFEYYPYTLKSRYGQKSREGCLLRVLFNENLIGYSDCHVWEELGDKPLKEQLIMLKQGKHTNVIQRSLYFALIDAQARLNKQNLFADKTIPQSHWLIPNLENSKTCIAEGLNLGFHIFKIKLGKDLGAEIPQLKQLFKILPKASKVRLDFNLRISRVHFHEFLDEINEYIEKVDFFEDPFTYTNDEWKEIQQTYGISLACDHNCEQAVNNVTSSEYLVIKPAIQDLPHYDPESSQKLLFTTYLDHPLGQLAAAYIASVVCNQIPKQVVPCGLVSHQVYETNEFSAQLDVKDTVLVPPEGTGFGFDKLLANLNWQVFA